MAQKSMVVSLRSPQGPVSAGPARLSAMTRNDMNDAALALPPEERLELEEKGWR